MLTASFYRANIPSLRMSTLLIKDKLLVSRRTMLNLSLCCNRLSLFCHHDILSHVVPVSRSVRSIAYIAFCVFVF